MKSHLRDIEQKIVTLTELTSMRDQCRSKDQRVVFTNGCFDILHLGHVTYLAKAADCGEILVIGLNSDNSVKRQGKGDDRPINSENSRALLLASLSVVDFVVIFDEDTPRDLISILQPDVLVKGGDYDEQITDSSDPKYIVGSDLVLAKGGQVKTINLVDGFSTTSILNKIKS